MARHIDASGVDFDTPVRFNAGITTTGTTAQTGNQTISGSLTVGTTLGVHLDLLRSPLSGSRIHTHEDRRAIGTAYSPYWGSWMLTCEHHLFLRWKNRDVHV